MASAAVARRPRAATPTPPVLAASDIDKEEREPSSSAAAAPLLSDDVKQDGLSPEERLCAICLVEPVEVMLLPCRHAVLCKGCAVIVQRGGQGSTGAGSGSQSPGQGMGDGRCPICRVRVMGAVQGTFEEDYVRLVTAAEAKMEWVQGSAYEGMYNHVKPLMLTGALSAAGSVACFVLLPPPLSLVPGVVLAGTSFVVGYLPWFATTVAAFEAENMSVSQSTSVQLISREDLSRPLTLLAKATMIAVAAPVAAAVFFGPYLCYAYIVRPMSRYMLFGFIRGTCFSYVYIFKPACTGLAWVCTKTFQGLGVALKAIYDYVLTPSWWAAASAAKALYSYVLAPGGRLMWAGLESLGLALKHTASFVWSYVLSPACDGVCAAAKAALDGVCVAMECIMDYVLAPIWHGVVVVGRYVLVPLARGLWMVVEALVQGLAAGARLTYTHVLVPCAHGLAHGAVAMYTLVLIPGGRLLWAAGAAAAAGASAVMGGIAAAGTLAYTAVLVPVGTALGSAASAAYAYVLVPAGRCLGAVALLAAAGARLAYDQVLQPLGSTVCVVACEGAALVGHVGSQVAGGMGSAIEATGSLLSQIGQEMWHIWQGMTGTNSHA